MSGCEVRTLSMAPVDLEAFKSGLRRLSLLLDGASNDVWRISGLWIFCLLGMVFACPLLLLTGIEGSTALMKTNAGRSSPAAVLVGKVKILLLSGLDTIPKVSVVLTSKFIILEGRGEGGEREGEEGRGGKERGNQCTLNYY